MKCFLLILENDLKRETMILFKKTFCVFILVSYAYHLQKSRKFGFQYYWELL